MQIMNVTTLLLVAVGGLNWGLVGVFDWNLVAAIFGAGSILARTVYVLVALSAIWQLATLFTPANESVATAGRRGSAH